MDIVRAQTHAHIHRFVVQQSVPRIDRVLKYQFGRVFGDLLDFNSTFSTGHQHHSFAVAIDQHASFARLSEFGGDEFPLPTEAPLTNFEAKYRIQGRARNRGSWRRLPESD